MDTFANILIAVALLVVLGTLILGFIALGDRSEEARVRSNNLMRWRVITQAVAVGVLFIAFAIKAAG